MKTYKKYITIHTSKKIDFLNITEQVRKAVLESGVEEGLVLVNAMHIKKKESCRGHKFENGKSFI